MKEKNSKKTKAWEIKSAIKRARERKEGTKKNEEMGNEWEGDGTLTTGSTFEFHPKFGWNDFVLDYEYKNKLAWCQHDVLCRVGILSRKRWKFNEDDIQKLDEILFMEKYHAFFI